MVRLPIFAPLTGLSVSANLVAHAPYRSNQGPVVSGIHLAAKVINVHVNDIRHRVKIEFPDLLNNSRTGNRLALVAHQEFKQSKFLRAEIDVLTSATHVVVDTVDFEVFNLENGARGPAPSAEYPANARGKFGNGSGCRDVIVRTGVELAD